MKKASGGKGWSPLDPSSLSDDELLKKRICHFRVQIEETYLESCIAELYTELEAKKLLIRPTCYLADEWFVPTRGTVIGIPFYLAHPRLIALERSLMHEVEGDTAETCMTYLRHEAGHVVYNAFQLQRKKKIRTFFGPPSPETPASYHPNPSSKDFVLNLPDWYAQCDPDEDFAETFAVWLTPNSDWKTRYEGWKALDKLMYMDDLMQTLRGKPPLISTEEFPCRASRMQTILANYYREKRKHKHHHP